MMFNFFNMRWCEGIGKIRYRYIFLAICISVGVYVQIVPLDIKHSISQHYTEITYIIPEKVNKILQKMNFNTQNDEVTMNDEGDFLPENIGKMLVITSYHRRLLNLGRNSTISRLHLTSDSCNMFKNEDLETLVIKAIEDDYFYIYINSNTDYQNFKYLQRFNYRTEMSILSYNGNSPLPLTRHFTTVPRDTGYNTTIQSGLYQLGLWKTALIQKVLHKNEIQTSGKIDVKAPPIAVRHTTLPLFLMEDVLIHYDAFWSIISFDHSIWSSWVQRLLQELDSWVAFTAVKSSASTCDVDKHFQSNISKQMLNWKCDNRTDFVSCVKSLNKFMLSENITSGQNVENINRWLDVLIKHGYKQPKLVESKRSSRHEINKVLYMPSVSDVPHNLDDLFQGFCNGTIGRCPIATDPFTRSSSFLMVLVFNRGVHYNHVEYLINVYLPAFSHILICGTNMENYQPVFKVMKNKISFVEMPPVFTRGERGYLCLEAAIKMNYHIGGYLHLGDDVLFNLWNLPKVPTDKVWFQESIRPANITQKSVPDIWKKKTWWPWNSRAGQPALNAIIKHFQNISQDAPVIKSFLNKLEQNAGGVDRGFYQASDIYYVPIQLSQLFSYFCRLFLQYGVYLEVAIPTILMGITDIDDVVRLNGSYLWYEDRNLYRKFYNESHIYLHSLKEGPCVAMKICREFLCNRYIPCLDMNGSQLE